MDKYNTVVVKMRFSIFSVAERCLLKDPEQTLIPIYIPLRLP